MFMIELMCMMLLKKESRQLISIIKIPFQRAVLPILLVESVVHVIGSEHAAIDSVIHFG